jgi:hypothetical protein
MRETWNIKNIGDEYQFVRFYSIKYKISGILSYDSKKDYTISP